MPRLPRLVRSLGGPALALVTLALTIGALEAYLRWTTDAPTRAALPHVGVAPDDEARLRWLAQSHRYRRLNQPDPLLGWRPRPRTRLRGLNGETVTVGREGLRGKSRVVMPKPVGRLRIGILGCSQTFGTGVGDQETFSAVLGELMPGADILNFGVGGYGTDQMLLRYETLGRDYDLDVVVLGFAFFHLTRNVQSFRFFAKPRFVLAADGTLALSGVPVPGPDVVAATAPPRTHPTIDSLLLFRWAWQRLLDARSAREETPGSAAWTLTAALVDRLVADARSAGSRVVVVNLDQERPDVEDAMAAMAARSGFAFLNLGPLLRSLAEENVKLRQEHDPHFTPLAHRVVAAELFTFLTQELPAS